MRKPLQIKLENLRQDRVLNILSLEDRTQKSMAKAMVQADLTLDKVERCFFC
jgi:hypothetical protein